MREFIVYSATASTAPIIKDLKGAGRIDILLHSIISALFASNEMRQDVKLHLILMGPPNAPRHITLEYNKDNTISKKDMKKLIEMALRKCKPGQIKEIHPGVFVDDKKIEFLVDEMKNDSKNLFVLDAYGTLAKEIVQEKKDLFENPVFILGDHEGFDKQTKKFLKKNTNRLSLGPQMYLTSQAITILNYELDNL
ncbi:MAG: hypothetical protein VXZ40_04005 [Nanoarchaeota archaeon]|nr:hypothetical protein [Nanoarchaeota archaeon]